MRHFEMMRMLLAKEWRDTRALTWCALILSLVAGVAFHVSFRNPHAAGGITTWLEAPMTVAFAVVLAAEVASNDAAERRLETLALLPVGLTTLWIGKVSFVLIASAGFFAWTMLTQGLLAVAFGTAFETAMSAHDLAVAIPVLVVGSALVTATLAFATVLTRGLQAVLLVTMLAVATWLVVRECPWGRWDLRPRPGHLLAAAGAVAVLFAASGITSFVRAPVFRSRLRRRFVIGAAIPLGALVLAAGGSAFALERSFALDPDDAHARVANVLPSPNGRWLALEVSREESLFSGCAWTWLLDAGSGSIQAIGGHHVTPNFWESEHALHVARFAYRGWGIDDVTKSFDWVVDVETGAELDAGPVTSVARDWADTRVADGKTTVIEWRAAGRDGTFRTRGRFCDLSRAPARVISMPAPDRLVVTDLLTDRETTLWSDVPTEIAARFAPGDTRLIITGENLFRVLDAETGAVVADPCPGRPAFPSPCGTSGRPRVLLRVDGDWQVIDGADGRVIAGPFEKGVVKWATGANDARFLFRPRFHGAHAQLVDLDSCNAAELDDHVTGVVVLAGGRIAAWSRAGVDEIDETGRVIKRLYPR